MEYLCNQQKGTLVPAHEDITPLHLAAKHEYLELVEKILDLLDTPYDDQGALNVLSAIVSMTQHGEMPLSQAASGSTKRLRDIENVLRNRVSTNIERFPTFFCPQPTTNHKPLSDLAEVVLELAAHFLRKIPDRTLSLNMDALSSKDEWYSLHLAVYHQCAIVVWWLLSYGGYLNKEDINNAIDIVKQQRREDSENKPIEMIGDLLSSPPPILTRREGRDDHLLPDFQFEPQDYKSLEEIIFDFHLDEDSYIGFQMKRRPVNDIIHNEGPRKIMRVNKYRNLNVLKDTLGTAQLVPRVRTGKKGIGRPGEKREPQSQSVQREVLETPDPGMMKKPELSLLTMRAQK
ncbi:hypothetical protein TSTA_002830 [Talaromyces stipitatus ATCC 10500]|uniref:Ankyrin repeat protein n=1 Tax=Talaromyces stipitatus (strain ATCC 10500 / CBS 375.48 / QM 6759 / NRRL 1006) TaxID=441959 RepID=B8MS86_TALSN|nr:uncharacterized protein TSTA_002830 [Talaromyces stipitatus ATCC 10500]EED12219.1 hypothetical protein TSTA_002830 [Talaromyces stipitatus ATCC 10500]